MQRSRPVAGALVTLGMILATTHGKVVVLVLAGVFVLLYLGLVLPAIWSADVRRRRDARAVLQQFLDLARQPRSP
jgi:hypothetical protein